MTFFYFCSDGRFWFLPSGVARGKGKWRPCLLAPPPPKKKNLEKSLFYLDNIHKYDAHPLSNNNQYGLCISW